MASNQAVVEVEIVDVTNEVRVLRQITKEQTESIKCLIEEKHQALQAVSKFETLLAQCEQWGRDRMIIQNGRLDTQALKLCEEASETLIAARKIHALTGTDAESMTDAYYEELADGIGDTIVVLVQLCAMSGLDMYKCLEGAYETIKDRRGYLNEEGVFVKETT